MGRSYHARSLKVNKKANGLHPVYPVYPCEFSFAGPFAEQQVSTVWYDESSGVDLETLVARFEEERELRNRISPLV